MGRQPGGDGGDLRSADHLPAHPRRLGRGGRGGGWLPRHPAPRHDLGRDVDDGRGRGHPPGRQDRRQGGVRRRLPGLGRLPPGGHRQHLDLRGLRAAGVRTPDAGADHAGTADPAHRPPGLGLDPEGDDQLLGDRQPADGLRGDDDDEGGGHGSGHHLRGDQDLVGHLVRARNRKPDDPERLPRHQLHDGSGAQRHRPV